MPAAGAACLAFALHSRAYRQYPTEAGLHCVGVHAGRADAPDAHVDEYRSGVSGGMQQVHGVPYGVTDTDEDLQHAQGAAVILRIIAPSVQH